MDLSDSKPANRSASTMDLRLDDLYRIDTYLRKHGCSDFEYDEELDVFRFPEDGCFAFCKEFADWRRLRQRGYMGS